MKQKIVNLFISLLLVMSFLPVASVKAATMPSGTIVDIASSDPQFSTLVAAVKAAGLADTLSGTGPFTVFAPTNAAFNKLGTTS